MRVAALAIILCSITASAQTAKVIALSPEDAKQARALDDAQKALDEDFKYIIPKPTPSVNTTNCLSLTGNCWYNAPVVNPVVTFSSNSTDFSISPMIGASLAAIFTLALASATWILGYRRGEKVGKESRQAEITELLKLGHEQCLAAFIDGKEQGVREATPPHDPKTGRFSKHT